MTFTHLPPATHHPDRDLSWQTEGGEIARTARLMGVELMPWQRKAVDVATEYRPGADGQRHYRYREVIITVPRQSGKTTLVGPVQLHGALTRPRSQSFFTAQTGKDARKRMAALIDMVGTSPAAPLFKPVRAAGGSGFACPNGSYLLHFAPTKSALHGETPFRVTFDEFWKYDKDLGVALEGAASPGQITLGDRSQLWWISTKGTVDSEFMNEKIAAGLKDPSVCVIEYSLPAGADPYEPAAWWQFHPALGNTITEADLKRETRLPKSEWLRAYCNLVTITEHAVIDLDHWDTLADHEATPPARDALSLAFEVAPDNAAAAVVASWRDAAGTPLIRTVHRAPGSAWLVPYVAGLLDEWGLTSVTCDGAGPAQRHAADLEARGYEVRRLTMAEFGQACETLLATARDESTLRHVPIVDESGEVTDPFRDDVAALELRSTNGVRRFSRDHSPRPIVSITAAAVALYAHDHAPVPVGPQLFV